MKKFNIDVRKVRRKGLVAYVYSFEVSKKTFVCQHGYKTEATCRKAAKRFVTTYLGAK